MSRFRFRPALISLALVISSICSVGHADQPEFTAEIARGPMSECVEFMLRASGIDPSMQNRWNPRTYVGRIQLEIVRKCDQLINDHCEKILNENGNR